MFAHLEQHPDPLQDLAGLALVTSAAALSSSLYVDNEIGGAVFYGAFIACLCSAVLLFSYRLSARNESDIGARASAPKPARSSSGLAALIPRLPGQVRAEVTLVRQSASRLGGTLSVVNSTQHSVSLSEIEIHEPEGARIAVTEPSDVADWRDEITVRFSGAHAELDCNLEPGERTRRALYVLLPSNGTRAKHAYFGVELRSGNPSRTLKARCRIPA